MKYAELSEPRAMLQEGVSTHGAAMRVCGVENPQGFGSEE